MSSIALHPLADRIVGGNLNERLIAWRSEGLSYNAIARELHALGITTTGETVRKWVRDIEAAS